MILRRHTSPSSGPYNALLPQFMNFRVGDLDYMCRLGVTIPECVMIPEVSYSQHLDQLGVSALTVALSWKWLCQ